MNQQAKTKRPFPYVGLILWVTLALVVLILGHTVLDSIGVFGMAKAGETNGAGKFKLTENQVDVYRYQVAQNQLYMEYMYVLYGMMEDPTGGLIQTMSADQYIAAMLPLTVASGTYDSMAYDYAEQYLTYCEGAKDPAVNLYDTYKKETAADIDEYIENLKKTAEANDMSFRAYLKNNMGNGVSESDVRSAMEYYYVAMKYAEKLTDDFSASVTPEDEIKYRDEHKASFFTTDYTAYKLVSTDLKADIEKCKTVDDVKAVIVNYYLGKNFETNYKTNFTDKNVEDTAGKDQTKADVLTTLLALSKIGENKEVFKDSTDNTAYQKAAYAIVKAINSNVTSEFAKITETSASYVDVPMKADDKNALDADKVKELGLSEVQTWLFANEGKNVKTGDTKLVTTMGSDGTTVSYYTWYMVGEKIMTLDEEHTKNAHYILLSDDADTVTENKKTAQQKATEFHEALSKITGDKDAKAAKFQELVETYAPGYSSELVEYISYDDMKSTYEDLATWLYAEDRKEGDISNVIVLKNDTKDKEKVTGCLIALYMGENEETWKVNATQAIAGELVTKWYEEKVKEYGVVINYEFETETETTAASK